MIGLRSLLPIRDILVWMLLSCLCCLPVVSAAAAPYDLTIAPFLNEMSLDHDDHHDHLFALHDEIHDDQHVAERLDHDHGSGAIGHSHHGADQNHWPGMSMPRLLLNTPISSTSKYCGRYHVPLAALLSLPDRPPRV